MRQNVEFKSKLLDALTSCYRFGSRGRHAPVEALHALSSMKHDEYVDSLLAISADLMRKTDKASEPEEGT